MTTPLLQSKLYKPHPRPQLVPRPRLIESLNENLIRKLTLISAPAGFGKTTVVSEWVSSFEQPAAWLSLDENDNDLARFLTYLIAALQTLELDIGKGASNALLGPQPPPAEVILTVLINEIIANTDRVVLALDDYHLIEARPVHDALSFLIEQLPPQMHLIIATREDPLLPLARLRARGQLTELRATDLRFTSPEAAAFLNEVMKLDLSDEDVAALEERTEGWIAGLQLAAISMQGRQDITDLIRSFSGSHRHVLDYLAEEVLDSQSEEVRSFLLRTSILDRMTGSSCDALTGKQDGQATLESLERANLFLVPLDDERRWYRYHHLFSDLIRRRLHQVQPELVPTMHRVASEWHERNGLLDEAIEHALRAEDLEKAAHLINEHADAVWLSGEHSKLRQWLDKLPEEMVLLRPQLCILRAWNLFSCGEFEPAEQSLQAAERALDTSAENETETLLAERERYSGTSKTRLKGRTAALRAILASYRGDVPAIIRYSQKALDHLSDQDWTWRSVATNALGDAYSLKGEFEAAFRARLKSHESSNVEGNTYHSLVASLKLAVTLRVRGQLRQIVEICQQQWQIANKSGWAHTAGIGWLLAIWGEVLAELDDLDGALRLAEKGAKLTESSGDIMMLCWSNLCLMRVLLSRRDIAGAQDILQRLHAIHRELALPSLIGSPLSAWQARLWLAQNRLDAASHWVKERGLGVDDEITLLHETEYIVFARILIAQSQLTAAHRLLQRLLEVTESGGRTIRVIEILMLRALAFQAGRYEIPKVPWDLLQQSIDYVFPFLRTHFKNPSLSLARAAYTYKNRTMCSKIEAGMWALSEFDTKYHQMIANDLSSYRVGTRYSCPADLLSEAVEQSLPRKLLQHAKSVISFYVKLLRPNLRVVIVPPNSEVLSQRNKHQIGGVHRTGIACGCSYSPERPALGAGAQLKRPPHRAYGGFF